MKVIYCLLAIICLTRVVQAQFKKDSLLPKGQLEGVKATNFTSAINQREYILYVKLPSSYHSDSATKYPVLYVLDAQWVFPYLMDVNNGLIYDNLVGEAIYVGISWRNNYFANRNRDFTPTHTDFDSASGGAPKFLEVITKEIIVHIDSAYRTDKNKLGLVGGSSGGLFTLYALFQQPSPFHLFISMSPSLWYDNLVLFATERKFSETHSVLKAKLFMTSGGYEESNNPPVFGNFIAQLRKTNYKGLEMESLVIDKTGHLSASPYAMSRGLQYIFETPDLHVDTSLLNQYTGHYEDNIFISQTGGSIYLEGMGLKLKMNAASRNRFYVKGNNGFGEFIISEKGNVAGLKFTGADGQAYLKKID